MRCLLCTAIMLLVTNFGDQKHNSSTVVTPPTWGADTGSPPGKTGELTTILQYSTRMVTITTCTTLVTITPGTTVVTITTVFTITALV